MYTAKHKVEVDTLEDKLNVFCNKKVQQKANSTKVWIFFQTVKLK